MIVGNSKVLDIKFGGIYLGMWWCKREDILVIFKPWSGISTMCKIISFSII